MLFDEVSLKESIISWSKSSNLIELKKLSSLIDSAVFPGTQGGPLEHIIAAKAVAFREAQVSQPRRRSILVGGAVD